MKSIFWYFVILMLLIILSIDGIAWWDATFDYRINFTINSSKIDSTLSDFPVFVKLNASNFNFSEARSDGHDVRFLDSSNNLLLDFHRVRHDSSEEKAEYWVSIPEVSSNSDVTFSLYYGNNDASDVSSSSSIWDENYVGVFHMDDDTSTTILDFSSRGNDGTKSGFNQPTEIEGEIAGLAQSYNPSTHYISVGTSGMTVNRGTISFWVNVNELSEDMDYRFIGHTGPLLGWNNRIIIGCRDTENMDCGLYVGIGGTSVSQGNILDLIPGKWYNIVLTYEGSSFEVYVDGISLASGNYFTFNRLRSFLDIGNSGNPVARTYSPSAVIDEVRISNIVRSNSWIVASYHSENNSLLSASELEIVDKPFFQEINLNSEIFLNPGMEKTVHCNGTVNHIEGFSLIGDVSAYFYHESSSPDDELNRRYIYHDGDCTTIDTQINGRFECSFEVYFFAMPGDWFCEVSAQDTKGAKNSSSVATYIEEMISITVDSNLIDFGLQTPGTDSGTTDFPSEIYNRGNVPLDVNIRTFDYDENPEGAMDCTVGLIPFENVRLSTSPDTPILDKIYAPQEGINMNIGLLPQMGASATQPTSFMFYWGFIIPQNIAGTCNGHIRYTAYIAE